MDANPAVITTKGWIAIRSEAHLIYVLSRFVNRPVT